MVREWQTWLVIGAAYAAWLLAALRIRSLGLPGWRRALWTAQRTLVGRLLLGPAMVIWSLWFDIVRRRWRGDGSQLLIWAQHLALLALMLWGVAHFAGIGPIRYVLTIGYPALGLSMLRSACEHRPAEVAAHRIVVVEAGWFWRLLYLNNNYHAVHHDHPGLAWHLIRRRYLAERESVLARNGQFIMAGYGSLICWHSLSPIDSPVHPTRN